MPQERQALNNPPARVFVTHKAPLLSDANCGQPKAGGRYTRRGTGVVYADITAILDQSCRWVGLLPEKQKTAVLEVIQELIVFRRQH